jgi:hypothetical protein
VKYPTVFELEPVPGIVDRLSRFVWRSGWTSPDTMRTLEDRMSPYRTARGFRVRAIRLPEPEWSEYLDAIESRKFGGKPGTCDHARRTGRGVFFQGIPVERR